MAADAELRRLIREGFECDILGEQLAEAAGLSVPRVYQIRDGRRSPGPHGPGRRRVRLTVSVPTRVPKPAPFPNPLRNLC